MRWLSLVIVLLTCASLTGCGGGTAAGASGSVEHVSAAAILATPTPAGGLSTLLKTESTAAPRPTATPTPAGTPVGPMSCLERRLQAMRAGKLLPSGNCQ